MRAIRLPHVSIRLLCAAAAVLVVGVSCQSDRVGAPPAAAVNGQAKSHLDAVPAADPDSVRIHYLCENRFRIRNANDLAIAVQWVVLGTADSGTVVLPARTAGAPFSEIFLDVPDSGTVQVFFGGVRIATARNTGAACTTRQLTVRLDPGVVTTLGSLDSAYAIGTAVSYSFVAAPGYTHVLVALDDRLVPDTGTVVMGASHVLWAAADVDVTLPPPTDPLVVELRGLLSAADPVSTYQQILDDAGALFNAVGPEEAARRVKLAGLVAYDPIRDSSALIRVDNALALHAFTLGSSEYDGSGADGGGGGGGGGLISNRMPVAGGGASRDVAPGGPCSPQRSPEVPGSPEPTRVVFVNGIRTTLDESINASHSLRCALDAAGQLQNSRVIVDRFYNRTWTVQVRDAMRRDSWCILAGIRWSSYWSPLARIAAYSACAADAAVTSVRTQDYIEAFRAFAAIDAGAQAALEDADSLARYLNAARRVNGEHVIAIAHSEGNLLTQQAVKSLRDSGWFAPRTDSLCIGAVAVAAPTSANWPIAPDYLLGLQVPGDLLSLLTRRNRFPVVATPASDSAAAVVARIRNQIANSTDHSDRQALTALLNVVLWSQGVQLHSMTDSYLGEQPTREVITDDIARIHRQCTLGHLALAPAYTVLRVQANSPLDLSATNRNGATMRLNRDIAWGVPLTLALSRNAHRITAVSPGAGEISARVFDRQARAYVDVPMEALDVFPVQTLRTSWKFALASAPMDHAVPDPGPGPAWDGVPSHCIETRTLTEVDPVTGDTWAWEYLEHCWFEASGAVQPPDGIRIFKYWWRWYDITGAERDSHTDKPTVYSVPDMPADPESLPFPGWGRLEVWGLNADGTPIAKGMACIANCGGAP